MVDPARVGDGSTTMFLAGDDAEARATVRALLEALGWQDIVEFEELSARPRDGDVAAAVGAADGTARESPTST